MSANRFSFSKPYGQIVAKCVVDRFYSFTYELTGMRKKAALLAVAWDNTDTVFKVTRAYYETIYDYMHF